MHNSNTPSFLLIRIVAIRSSCVCLAGELNVNIELYETNNLIRKISGIKSLEKFVSVYTEKDSMIKTAQKQIRRKIYFESSLLRDLTESSTSGRRDSQFKANYPLFASCLQRKAVLCSSTCLPSTPGWRLCDIKGAKPMVLYFVEFGFVFSCEYFHKTSASMKKKCQYGIDV